MNIKTDSESQNGMSIKLINLPLLNIRQNEIATLSVKKANIHSAMTHMYASVIKFPIEYKNYATLYDNGKTTER